MDLRDLETLRLRFGEEALGHRLARQIDLARRAFHRPGGPSKAHYWTLRILIRGLKILLRSTGLGRLGIKNAKSMRVTEVDVPIPDLPPALDRFRILHLSDLHIDSGNGLREALEEAINPLRYDVVLITGDFRFHDRGSGVPTAREMQALVPHLECEHGVYGVLGNHDAIEQALLLEECGMKMLLNENARLEVGGANLWLVGVDDPHFYQLDDLSRAGCGIPDGDVRILLAHSPELYEEAARAGISLYLCGHTHGGQLCFPGGFAPILEARCPRRFCRGEWSLDGMRGYTSRGVGASGVFARFFCPPEIVIHRLVPAERHLMPEREGDEIAGKNAATSSSVATV